MILWFLTNFFSDHLITNLFRYTTFRAFLAALLSFIVVTFFMPALIRWLKKQAVGQVVREDGPETHKKKNGTPTMGGVLMVVGILLASLLLCRLENGFVWIALFALVSFAAVGFTDDYLKLTKKNPKGVSFRAKMISMGILSLFVGFLMTNFMGVESKLIFPFFKNFVVDLGPLFYVWAFLVINGSANAVNLTDGLDGLAIVPIITTALVLLIVTYVSGHIKFAEYLLFEFSPGAGELSVMLAATIGVGLGFLWYNAHPAEVFMGDVGSLSLGGFLGTVALIVHQEFVLLIAGFLFVLEAVSVILQVGSYKSRKKRIFRMAPLHHHFELGGWPEPKVIVRFWILSILFAIVALSTLKIR